jgi:hypothetical protein
MLSTLDFFRQALRFFPFLHLHDKFLLQVCGFLDDSYAFTIRGRSTDAAFLTPSTLPKPYPGAHISIAFSSARYCVLRFAVHCPNKQQDLLYLEVCIETLAEVDPTASTASNQLNDVSVADRAVLCEVLVHMLSEDLCSLVAAALAVDRADYTEKHVLEKEGLRYGYQSPNRANDSVISVGMWVVFSRENQYQNFNAHFQRIIRKVTEYSRVRGLP